MSSTTPGFESGTLGNVIRPVTVGGKAGKSAPPAHVSTPHTSSATTTKAAPPWLTSASLTNQQIQDQATSQANAAIAPQVGGLQGQQASYDAQQKAYEAAMTGFYAALAPYMQGVSGAQSAAYNSAATAMGDIAHGYSGALGASAQANADATTAALARAGQTQAIDSAAAQANPGSALTDAFGALHGGIQGTSFAEEGAAKAAASATLPATWAAQGRDSMTEAINKAVAGDQGWADKISQVYATVPALRQTILTQIQNAEAQKADFQLKVQGQAFDQAAKTTQLNQANSRLNLQAETQAFNEKYQIAGLRLRGEQLNLSAQKFAQETLNQNRAYGVALARLGISARAEQRAALAQEYKLQNGGFTPAQVNKFNTTAYSIANDAFKAGGTYAQAFDTMQRNGVPISVAEGYLNQTFPPTQRPVTPQALKDHSKTTGVGSKANGNDLVTFASSMLGTPYVWGGNSPGKALDCSGFIQQVYQRVGISIPRTTYAQVKAGKPVSLNNLQPGDAIFTIPGKKGPEHVAMYIGNGQVQVSPSKGDVNKIISLKDYLALGFVAARRYLHG